MVALSSIPDIGRIIPHQKATALISSLGALIPEINSISGMDRPRPASCFRLVQDYGRPFGSSGMANGLDLAKSMSLST
jgi:hypothetical protein